MILIFRGLIRIVSAEIIQMESYKTELIAFGRRVRLLRMQLGVSQEKLAEFSELDRTYIGGIERGERNPSLKNIIKLASALHVQPFQLFQELHDE